MAVRIVIPARLQSTRLPEKVLADVNGLPMVVRSYRQAEQVPGVDTLLVATDSKKVQEVCESYDVPTCLTDPSHPSGTSRLAEVVSTQGWDDSDIVVCLQADEPLLPPPVVSHLIDVFSSQTHAPMGSVYDVITDSDELSDPSIVKVVLNQQSEAIYFSRAPIPWDRDGFVKGIDSSALTLHHRHIGLYAYRAGFLAQYLAWEASPLEAIESLEQLRVLYHGESIAMARASEPVPPGVDTPEDLAKVRALLTLLS